MLILITGGSASGKSEYAEQLVGDLGRNAAHCIYVATMYPYQNGVIDDEVKVRIEKHRRMRADKGFSTVECYTDLRRLSVGKDDIVLLECMSNLLANEMYLPDGHIGCPMGDITDSVMEQLIVRANQGIVSAVCDMAKIAKHVIVVTNEVFSDGCVRQYDASTKAYMKLLGEINIQLAGMADKVTEVVCKIPVCIKE
ncbi:MAG: bifunctional adenosylcobinamide kinase/adenosylcobinamide-phosphate guanylyltransferase [Eubacteriales bacterium]|nr:bifunctional adenosylcobinamide kinase/adenosylcobinamide-phosphate guanylyltransferase [Lachnospiraceae bacterium]MDO5127998.1 bifunctional adenosylcobinamide kinase/adenosylcobinamide-phosphate guanylyltransferase [Eubacteriales bacterium]